MDVEKLVVNLSSHPLTEPQLSVLSKGLNFCPTPGEPDLGVTKEDMDRFHRDLRRKAFGLSKRPLPNNEEIIDDSDTESDCEVFPSEMPPFKHYKFKQKSTWNPIGPRVLENFAFLNEEELRKQKVFAPQNKNLSKERYKAIKDLACNKEIVIKPADKGGAIVILDKKDYLAEGYKQLSDPKVYKKLDKSKTIEFHHMICKYLEHCYQVEREISKDTFLYLSDFIPKSARLYLLPKIHKKTRPPPGRPVISSNGCPTERISEFVDFFLKPYVCKTKSYIKDTNDFLLKLQSLGKIEGNSILFTLDVVSLYTNIPTEFGLKWISDFLDQHRLHSKKPSNDMLIKLLEYVLTCNEFTFNEEYFLQLYGTAIGTKVAPSYANLVVAIFELLYVYIYKIQPLCYHRFIDDIFGIWTDTLESLVTFVEYLNSKVDTLKFTLEYSTDRISFLDVMVNKNTDGTIFTDLFRKDTDARNYLHYNSAHPISCKNGIPYGQFLRVRRICSTLSLFDKRAVEMAHSFLDRGYPQELVEAAMIKARRKCRSDLLTPREDPETDNKMEGSVFLITTYNTCSNLLGNIVRKNAPLLTKNPKFRDFENLKIQPVYCRPKNLKDSLVRASLPSERASKTISKTCHNIVKCRYCPKMDKSGKIKSTVTLREYSTKININCQSSNLIYCITCNVCSKQYVGQTGRRILDRFQGHFSGISRKDKTTLINDHFARQDHNGIQDLTIHVLDFIHANPTSDTGKRVRLKIESAWMSRLKTTFPDGLNYLE